MNEPFGPEYVRPAQQDCSRCGCCTAVLCERGRNSPRRCVGHVRDEFRDTVDRCPCSAGTTKYTAAWRMAQVRVTRLARELPLTPEAVLVLRALADGQEADPDNVVRELTVRGLAQLLDLRPVITALGRTYLAASDDVRASTPIRVVDVDKRTRTARVEVGAWQPNVPVTVLLDQITTDSGLDVDSLTERWLEADANCHAPDADRLVLTGFRPMGPLPSLWVGIPGDPE